jgi:hypothetical protein
MSEKEESESNAESQVKSQKEPSENSEKEKEESQENSENNEKSESKEKKSKIERAEKKEKTKKTENKQIKENSEDIYIKAAEDLRKAMEGFGTDEEHLILVVTSNKTQERLKIKKAYEEKYKKNLIDDLKSELSGKFEDAMVALFKEPVEYDCECIYNAMKGAGTDENCLIEVIASRPNWLLEKIKKKYSELYKKELVEDIKGDTSGDFQKILEGILRCKRSEVKEINKENCEKIAKELSEAKEEGWVVNDESSVFYNYIINSSPKELSAIAREYYRLSGKTIIDGIENNFKGDAKDLLKSILYSLVSPSEYFATRIKKAIEGFGTDNKTLIRILITRCEVDMNIIKKYYKQLYKKDMIEDIKNDISGDYQKLMIELIK